MVLHKGDKCSLDGSRIVEEMVCAARTVWVKWSCIVAVKRSEVEKVPVGIVAELVWDVEQDSLVYAVSIDSIVDV